MKNYFEIEKEFREIEFGSRIDKALITRMKEFQKRPMTSSLGS